MPIIEGADMSSVSTERELLPEGSYTMTIKESELSEDGRSLIIKHRIDSAPDEAQARVGQEWWNWINIKTNDGKVNEIGFASIKKYLEAVFGKGSSESNSNDTDPLNGATVELYIVQKSYKKDGDDKTVNNVKRITKA